MREPGRRPHHQRLRICFARLERHGRVERVRQSSARGDREHGGDLEPGRVSQRIRPRPDPSPRYLPPRDPDGHGRDADTVNLDRAGDPHGSLPHLVRLQLLRVRPGLFAQVGVGLARRGRHPVWGRGQPPTHPRPARRHDCRGGNRPRAGAHRDRSRWGSGYVRARVGPVLRLRHDRGSRQR